MELSNRLGVVGLIDFIIYFEILKESKAKYLIALLTIIIIVSTLDWIFGWVNARFNKKILFESNIALYGIIKKMMYFVVLVLFMVVAFMLVPENVAFPALVALYVGYLMSELSSVMAHLGLADDGKKDEVFKVFLNRLFNKGSV